MAVSNPAKQIIVKNDAGANLNAATLAADDNTTGVKMGTYKTFGFWIDISASTGTSETLDITFEWSEDSTNGVNGTWAAIVEFIDGKRTAQAMAQITTTTGAFATYFLNPCSSKGYVRAKLDTGGTSPVYTIDNAYWVLKDAAQQR